MGTAQVGSSEVRKRRRSSPAERSRNLKKTEESEDEGGALLYKAWGRPFDFRGEPLRGVSSISPNVPSRSPNVKFMNLHIYASFQDELGVLFGEIHHYSFNSIISCIFTQKPELLYFSYIFCINLEHYAIFLRRVPVGVKLYPDGSHFNMGSFVFDVLNQNVQKMRIVGLCHGTTFKHTQSSWALHC